MVMADRPDVRTASLPVTAITVVGLAESLVNGLARVPFRRPWQGPDSATENLGRAVTRQVVRSFMGYSMGLPIEEFRSMEKALGSRVNFFTCSNLATAISGTWAMHIPGASTMTAAAGSLRNLRLLECQIRKPMC